jgi:hypothetical protein
MVKYLSNPFLSLVLAGGLAFNPWQALNANTNEAPHTPTQEPSPARSYEQHDTHEHGTAHLSIAVDGKTIEATFESPMANIVGFEHAPTTPEERQKLKTTKEPLEQGTPLLSFNAEANCALTHAEIASTLFLDENNNPSNPNNAATNNHNDLDATWTYECTEPNNINSANIKFFSIFGAGLNELHIEWITAKGASARDLTQDDTINF